MRRTRATTGMTVASASGACQGTMRERLKARGTTPSLCCYDYPSADTPLWGLSESKVETTERASNDAVIASDDKVETTEGARKDAVVASLRRSVSRHARVERARVRTGPAGVRASGARRGTMRTRRKALWIQIT